MFYLVPIPGTDNQMDVPFSNFLFYDSNLWSPLPSPSVLGIELSGLELSSIPSLFLVV